MGWWRSLKCSRKGLRGEECIGQLYVYDNKLVDIMENELKLTVPLRFWFQHFIKGSGRFEDTLHPVADITTIEQFWAFYQHFKRPSSLSQGAYIYLFQKQVKPVWQDPLNAKGGAFVLRFERTKSDRLWEDILLGFISAQKTIYNNVNGVRMKVKKDFTEMDFWVRSVEDQKSLELCRRWIVEVTTLNNDAPLEVIHFHNVE